MGRRRVVAGGSVLAVVTAVAFAVATVSSPSRASVTFTFSRLAGSDRYDTARVIAESSFTTSQTVMLATGEKFADALAGAYGAGVIRGPMLLTPSSTLASSTVAALQALKVKDLVLLGGTDAISAAVQNQLDSMGYSTGRIGGADRYQTAALEAEFSAVGGIGTVNGLPTAIVASGEDAHFPDALSASPMSYASHLPVLLTTTATLAPAAQQGLSALHIKHVLVIGGSAAVSDAVVGQIQQMNITVDRLAGVDRTDTAAQVADFEVATLAFSPNHVNLARGDLFPDSLSGGPHAGNELAPIVLTEDPNTLGQPTSNWLIAHATPLRDGHVFGGPAAVSDNVVHQAEVLVQVNSATSPPTTPTTQPGTTSTTGAPPPPMRLTSASASAGTRSVDVSYSQQAVCASVSGDGSDYVVSIVGGPDQGAVVPVSGASCQGLVNQVIGIGLAGSAPAFSSGDIVRIQTKAGSNGVAVSDATADQDPVGDSIQTTVP